jgi:hypothetical protein
MAISRRDSDRLIFLDAGFPPISKAGHEGRTSDFWVKYIPVVKILMRLDLEQN